LGTRNILAKAHWIVGITLGTFLAISGITGGLMAFAPELTAAASGANKAVENKGDAAMPIPALYERLLAQAADASINGLTVYSDPSRYVRVELAASSGGPPGPGSPPPTTRLADPYTGELVPESWLARVIESTNYWTREIHQGHWFGPTNPLTFIPRWGFALATFCLLLMAISGLYLRWPKGRSLRTWRGWFGINTRLKGRAFLFNLHAVLGTLVLVMYLISAHTGTMQAAPMRWYNASVRAVLGLPPMEEPGPRPGEGPGGPGEPGGPGGFPEGPGGPGGFPEGPGGPGGFPGGPGMQQAAVTLDELLPLTDHLYSAVPDFDQATLQLGRGQPALMYQTAGSGGRISVNQESGAVEITPMGNEDQGERSFGQLLVDRNQEIHEGRAFGVVGVSLMMAAGFAMPVFYITGWMMYLKRRRRERGLKQRQGETDEKQ